MRRNPSHDLHVDELDRSGVSITRRGQGQPGALKAPASARDNDAGPQKHPWSKENRDAPHPLHSMMARSGSFPPGVAGHLIEAYSEPGNIVFDPFCGRGTTVLEAILRARVGIGSDVAPDAVACARAKVTPVTIDQVTQYIETLRYKRYAITNVPSEVQVFYHPSTLSRLLCVRDRLLADCRLPVGDVAQPATFLLGCLLGILHGHASYSLSLSCSHVFGMAPSYVRKYAAEKNLEPPERDVRDCLRAKAEVMLKGEPVPGGLASVHESPAERYSFDGGRLTNRVSLIVTSPPYLNAQTYAKDAWLRLWLLGYDYRDVASRYLHTSSLSVYCAKMKPCLQEMLRVLTPDAYAVLVAGDVFITRKGRKVPVRTAEVLAEIADTLEPIEGFKFRVEGIVKDSIPGHTRCYSAVHKDANAHWDEEGNGTGVRIDRVLYLRKVGVHAISYVAAPA